MRNLKRDVMPRQARLDSPGTLHHVIIRGTEKRRIVDDETDRINFGTEQRVNLLLIVVPVTRNGGVLPADVAQLRALKGSMIGTTVKRFLRLLRHRS